MAEDRRIALAALAVTAVVGIVAPIGAVIATNAHDDHRLHSEQAQLDRSELRGVLDGAATSLYKTRRAFTQALRAAQSRRPMDAVLRPLSSQMDVLARSVSRVDIRLGSQAIATKRMQAAFSTAAQIEMSFLHTARESIAGEVLDARSRFGQQIGDFIAAAHQVAGSTPD